MRKYFHSRCLTHCVLANALLVAATAACDSSDEGPEAPQGSSGAGQGMAGQTGSSFQPDSGTGAGDPDLGQGGLDALRNSACAAWQSEPETQPAVVQLVVDNSGSMLFAAPGSDRSKWAITREALARAVESLPAASSVGVLYYPDRETFTSYEPQDRSACVNVSRAVDIAPLQANEPSQRDVLLRSFAAVEPNDDGGTPTLDAFQLAYERLSQSRAVGTRYMLLITDGQPTYADHCVGTGEAKDAVDEQPIVDAIAEARSQGVRTFVIGSPGSEQSSETGEDARPWLSRAAIAGGTRAPDCTEAGPKFCHFDMTEEPDFATGLQRALQAITGSIVSCVYELPEPPTGQTLNPANVNVVYTPGSGEPVLVPRDTSGQCTLGWDYNADNTQVVLCEETCRTVQNDARARLELLFGCATRPSVE